MIVLITGGSGFIGRNLCEQLSSFYDILAPSHSELDLLDENNTRKYFQKNNINIVVHAAVHPGHRNAKDPTNLFYRNTRMFFNIIRNNDKFKKIIFLSSGAIYDMRYYKPKMKEDYFDVHVPIDEHGYSKYVCAKHIELIDNAVELRLFGVFGKYEDWGIRFISNAICKALFDLPITIKQNRRFDYIYIDDLVKIIKYFIENEVRYKAYNVTPDDAIELKILAEKIIKISGKELEIKIAKPGMGIEYSGDNSRLLGELPNYEFTDIDIAIQHLYLWYKKNVNLIKRDSLLLDK